MRLTTRTRAAGLLALAAIGGTAAVAVTTTPASANTGYAICVPAGTPVETEPGGAVTFTMDGHQAWHVYSDDYANQWTAGYVSNTNPVQRGFVLAGHNDGRTPVPGPAGGDVCP